MIKEWDVVTITSLKLVTACILFASYMIQTLIDLKPVVKKDSKLSSKENEYNTWPFYANYIY